MNRPLKPRTFSRLANLFSFLARRERAAWNRATRARDQEEANPHLASSERWMRLMHAAESCPIKAEA